MLRVTSKFDKTGRSKHTTPSHHHQESYQKESNTSTTSTIKMDMNWVVWLHYFPTMLPLNTWSPAHSIAHLTSPPLHPLHSHVLTPCASWISEDGESIVRWNTKHLNYTTQLNPESHCIWDTCCWLYLAVIQMDTDIRVSMREFSFTCCNSCTISSRPKPLKNHTTLQICMLFRHLILQYQQVRGHTFKLHYEKNV
jgi:hypothetical protein